MKAECYNITASKSALVNGEPSYEMVNFRVLCTSHTQHCPNSTFLNGLSKAGEREILRHRKNGYLLTVQVGGREVGIEN